MYYKWETNKSKPADPVEVKEAVVPDVSTCNNCSRENAVDANFCQWCGTTQQIMVSVRADRHAGDKSWEVIIPLDKSDPALACEYIKSRSSVDVDFCGENAYAVSLRIE